MKASDLATQLRSVTSYAQQNYADPNDIAESLLLLSRRVRNEGVEVEQ